MPQRSISYCWFLLLTHRRLRYFLEGRVFRFLEREAREGERGGKRWNEESKFRDWFSALLSGSPVPERCFPRTAHVVQEIATPPTLPPTLETSDQWRNRPYRFVSGFNGGILNIRGCAIKYRASREYFGEACNRFERARSRGSLSRNCFHRAGHNFSFLSPLLFFYDLCDRFLIGPL